MTQQFKEFWMQLGAGAALCIITLGCIALFIPTLGHSWNWQNAYWNALCKWRPESFSNGG